MTTNDRENHSTMTYRRYAAAILVPVLMITAACVPPDSSKKSSDSSSEQASESPASEAPTSGEETPPEESSIGDEFESFWFHESGASSWDEIAESYPGGWEGHVLDVDDAGGSSLVVATNLDGGNPEGQKLAEQAATSIKNVIKMTAENGGDVPQSLRDNLTNVQIFDAQGNVLATESIEF